MDRHMVLLRPVCTLRVLAAIALLVAVLGVAGCTNDDVEDPVMDEAVTSTSDEAAADDEGDDADGSSAVGVSETELREGALNTAIAWFVGPMSDYTEDDFDWNVESLVEDDEGAWWARVSAQPNDPGLETEQIYVNLPAGMEIWRPIDHGTGIDPATDDRFPAEIRGAHGPKPASCASS